MMVVDQGVDEFDEIERLELEAVKACNQTPVLPDHAGHNTMHLITIRHELEFHAIRLG